MKRVSRLSVVYLSLLLRLSACGGSSEDGTPPGEELEAGDAGLGSGAAGNLKSDGGGRSSDAGASLDGAIQTPPASDSAIRPRDAASTDAAARVDSGVLDPGSRGDGDSVVSTFATQPELTDQGAPRGKSFRFSMDSTKSKIFDGKDSTLVSSKPRSLSRQIDVYVPAQYRDGTPAPVLIIQDGPGPFDSVSRALDNMTISKDATRKLPAFVVIAVQNGGNDAQGSERGLEYDTLSDRYARFIQEEVLPAVLADSKLHAAFPGLAFTDDPEGKATYGCSSGGAAAFTMAWFRPDLFRRVISYSGTFVAQQNDGQPESASYPLGAWEYHSSKKLIASSDLKPLRAFLNVNENDNGATAPESGHHNWVLANQRMAAALKAKGYHYRYVLAEGLGHCDGKAVQATLADTLAWTWAGYPTH